MCPSEWWCVCGITAKSHQLLVWWESGKRKVLKIVSSVVLQNENVTHRKRKLNEAERHSSLSSYLIKDFVLSPTDAVAQNFDPRILLFCSLSLELHIMNLPGPQTHRVKLFSPQQQADTVLLQETYTFKLNTLPHVYLAWYNSKQRGEALWLTSHFTHSNCTVDSQGRYIVINISICNRAAHYQNMWHKTWGAFLFMSFSVQADTVLKPGGDTNLVCNPAVDRLITAGSFHNW